ncbi:macrophage mannose receptor 1-like [Xyrichtys novacula]|uniref:Macrophage mannose receptor 1-like n=1 Tax=Xyrichtys novacula TaxID=13765 RepID=A0AAV1GW42_XYRNO|nr:macrophage mannose receptor 1-like [Xyrichtys novacula]
MIPVRVTGALTEIFFLSSALCLLPVCFPRRYILLEERRTWAGAQSYCREKYTDLASVHNQEESDQLVAAAQKTYQDDVWIGLYDSPDSWRWSFEDEGYYSGGESGFRRWASGQPNNFGGDQTCVLMAPGKGWNERACSTKAQFVCYDGKSDAKASSRFIYVDEEKTWKEAQDYCREHHTDLASVRNRAENDKIENMARDRNTWIGLYRDSWRWSDGSPYTFRNWSTAALKRSFKSSYAVLHQGQWQDSSCDSELFFVCYVDPVMKRRVLKVKLSQTDSSWNMEEAADAILQQIGQTLKEHGVDKGVRLMWRKQPDRKIFNKDEEEKKSEMTST